MLFRVGKKVSLQATPFKRNQFRTDIHTLNLTKESIPGDSDSRNRCKPSVNIDRSKIESNYSKSILFK